MDVTKQDMGTLTDEQLAVVKRFGFDRPKPYVVHVYGPDDVEEFDSWLDAVTFATARNAEILEYVARRFAEDGAEPPHLTKGWATPYTRESYDELTAAYSAPPVARPLPDREALELLAKHFACAASDWTDICDDDDHPLEHSNWMSYLDDARTALAAIEKGRG